MSTSTVLFVVLTLTNSYSTCTSLFLSFQQKMGPKKQSKVGHQTDSWYCALEVVSL